MTSRPVQAFPGGVLGDPAQRTSVLVMFADQFDIYLPVLVLAAAGNYFTPDDLSDSVSSLLSGLVFAAVLVTRPIGALLFGHAADTSGRAATAVRALVGASGSALAIALLPGADRIGVLSIGLLIALRALSGVFLGGVYTSAVPLAMERTRTKARGTVSGLLLACSPLAYASLGVLTIGLRAVSSDDTWYETWGWRVPFALGAVMTLVAAILFRRVAKAGPVTETRRARPDAGGTRPLRALLTGHHRRDLVQILVLMSGIWLANNMTSAVLPGLLHSHLGLDASAVSLAMTVEALVLVAAFPAFGALSQRIGRRRFYVGYGAVTATVGAGLYAALMASDGGRAATIALTVAVGLATVGGFGPVAAYITERFPRSLRATGFGVGYSLALVLPGFYPAYLTALGAVVPAHVAPVLLLVLAGALIAGAATAGPETREANLAVPGPAGQDPVSDEPSQGAPGATQGA